jgi:hypothetical protein
MIKVGAMAADWHRRAARALVNVIRTMPWSDDELLVFLMNQLAAYDILSCTTSFDLENVEAAIPATSHATGPLFSRILNLIHDITLRSRRDTASLKNQEATLVQQENDKDKALSRLRCDIEIARADTLMAAANVLFNSDRQRRDFVRLVDLHCKATMMYTHQVYWRDARVMDPFLVEDFFIMLKSIEDPHRSPQNLSWPLFIAGTEVRGDPEKQHQVIDIFHQICRTMGFGHFQELTKFLTSFWCDSTTDWSSCAEDWEMQGKRIMAV